MKNTEQRVSSFEFRVKKRSAVARLAPHNSRLAMTLIELMITVVILVTLIGAVLPLVSPNNDARKIAEAARGLQTYFMMAQAEAARTGRPVGVGFRETSPGSGVAVEAFQMVVPKPFPGSSSQSRIHRVAGGGAQMEVPDSATMTTYGPRVTDINPKGNGMTRYPQYDGAKLYAIRTQLATGVTRDDPLPPAMFRVGDMIDAQGNLFIIVDDPRHEVTEVAGMKFLKPNVQVDPYKDALICVRLDEIRLRGNVQPLGVPPSGYSYHIHRQPMGYETSTDKERTMTSAEAPFQFPAGVAIDLQGSGLETGGEPETFSKESETNPSNPPTRLKQIGLMFSPNGGIESAWVDGQRVTDASRIFLLLGRVENQNPQFASFDLDDQPKSAEELRDIRSKVNWLNPDSRWMMITANDGRFDVSQNAVFDPTKTDMYDEVRALGGQTENVRREATKIAQIEAAHGLGHQH